MVKTQSKKQKRSGEKPFNFYGIRKTRNPKYMSVSLVREDEDGERQWINAPVNIKNIIVEDDDFYLKLKFLSNEDEDEDASFKRNAKPKSKPKKSKYEDDEDKDIPF